MTVKQADLARRALDLYRNDSLRKAFAGVDPTQMRTLLAAFEQAGSLEEQEIVLRYQAARQRDKWDPKLVDKLLELCRDAGKGVERASAGGDPDERKAREAARQLGFIVRMHRVAVADAETKRGEGDRQGKGR